MDWEPSRTAQEVALAKHAVHTQHAAMQQAQAQAQAMAAAQAQTGAQAQLQLGLQQQQQQQRAAAGSALQQPGMLPQLPQQAAQAMMAAAAPMQLAAAPLSMYPPGLTAQLQPMQGPRLNATAGTPLVPAQQTLPPLVLQLQQQQDIQLAAGEVSCGDGVWGGSSSRRQAGAAGQQAVQGQGQVAALELEAAINLQIMAGASTCNSDRNSGRQGGVKRARSGEAPGSPTTSDSQTTAEPAAAHMQQQQVMTQPALLMQQQLQRTDAQLNLAFTQGFMFQRA